ICSDRRAFWKDGSPGRVPQTVASQAGCSCDSGLMTDNSLPISRPYGPRSVHGHRRGLAADRAGLLVSKVARLVVLRSPVAAVPCALGKQAEHPPGGEHLVTAP